MADIPCTCGALKSQHIEFDAFMSLKGTPGFEKMIQRGLSHHMQMYGEVCIEYRADNLTYLEWEVERREHMKTFGL